MKTFYLTATMAVLFCSLVSFAQEKDNKQFGFSPNNSNISISNGASDIIVAPKTSNVEPIIFNNSVYYINSKKEGQKTISKLMQYNIQNATTTDVSSKFTFTNEQLNTSEIVSIILDKKNEVLYLSSKLGEVENIAKYQTLKYNITTEKLSEYKDGMLTEISTDNHQTIIFYGIDAQGAYKKTYAYTENGELIKVSEKAYL